MTPQLRAPEVWKSFLSPAGPYCVFAAYESGQPIPAMDSLETHYQLAEWVEREQISGEDYVAFIRDLCEVQAVKESWVNEWMEGKNLPPENLAAILRYIGDTIEAQKQARDWN
jgi:hypothetical protein